MLIKIGDPIQLNLQLEDGNTAKYPRAILRNQVGTLLPESPVDLTHTGDGLYQNDTVAMPDTQEVTATFKVFSDSGHTTLDQRYSIELDVFTKDTTADLVAALVAQNLPGDITGFLDDTGALEGVIVDDGQFAGEIIDDGLLEGFIEDGELFGYLDDMGELVGYADAC